VKAGLLRSDRVKKFMVLDCPTAEALSQVAADDGWPRVGEFKFSDVTLLGIIELSREAVHGGAEAVLAADACLAKVPEARSLLREACAMLQGSFDPRRSQEHLFSAPERELWLVRDAASIESDDFSLFAHRFQRRLANTGFGIRYPYALSQALIEMTENVVRHSALSGSPPALGIVAYHVVREEMNYVVADLGRGVLHSLRENRKWAGLRTEADALVAAAKEGATRSPEHTEGDGFRLAFQGFLDREGVLAMRSGDGLARIHGNLNGRGAEMSNAAPLPGLRVAALCRLGGDSREILLKY
jgi:hypothetical protein